MVQAEKISTVSLVFGESQPSERNKLQLFLGNDGDSPENNHLCNQDVRESGFHDCVGEGRFLFIQMNEVGVLSLCSVAAF